jgi:hypothetical protein
MIGDGSSLSQALERRQKNQDTFLLNLNSLALTLQRVARRAVRHVREDPSKVLLMLRRGTGSSHEDGANTLSNP